MDDRTNVVACLSFCIGAVAGATVGLLYAPMSGFATRQRLGRGVDEATEKARNMKDQLVERGGKALAAASERSRRTAEALAGLAGRPVAPAPEA
jgi:gas vesicle protein